MSNNTVNVRTCSDSCSALLQLIQYIAADGDLVPSYEPEVPDASKAPSVSRRTVNLWDHVTSLGTGNSLKGSFFL